MKKTFPHLFERLAEQRQRRRSEIRSQDSQKDGADVPTYQSIGELRESRKGSRKRNTSLTASDIVNTQMDFTKTNPLVHETPVSLRQRSEYGNGRAEQVTHVSLRQRNEYGRGKAEQVAPVTVIFA